MEDIIGQVFGVILVTIALGFQFFLTMIWINHFRTWWRNRGWRAGMQIRLDEINKEYDMMEEFTLAVKEGFAGRGLLKGTLAVARSEDPEIKKFLIRFLEDGLQEISEEGREIERAIREL